MTWQRRVRLAVGAFLVAFVALLYFALARSGRQDAAVGPPRHDPEAIQEISPGTLTLVNGETISFTRQLTYADGRSVLQDVHVTMRESTGRVVMLEGREAFQKTSPNSDVGRLTVTGDVVITTSDGLRLVTDQVDYDDATRVLTVPRQLEFTRGRLTGSGMGATYDRSRDVLSLLARAQIAMVPDGSGAGALTATSDTARLDRQDHRVDLDRNVHVERPDRTVDAAQAVLHLNEAETHLTLAELRGGSRVARPDALPVEPGALTLMQAADIDLQYAPDGQTLRRSTLAGDAVIEVAGETGAVPRRILASRLDLALGADGSTLTQLIGQEAVQLELPGAGDRPAQAIRAPTLEATGVDGEGLRLARFAGGVEFRERSAATNETAAIDRVARSSTLELSLQPKLAGAGSARFLGNVTFTDGRWLGEAPEARYDPEKGALVLSGIKDRPGALPRVADDRVTVDAAVIELALPTRHLVAENRVQSVFGPAPRERRTQQGETAVRVPTLLSAEQPLYVAARRLVYDGETSVATYTGAARLWQGESLIRGDSLVLDDRRGNLSASGQVYSALPIGEARGAALARTIGEGREMQYDDATRRAVYRGKAHVNGPEGDLRGERIELFLGETGGALVRAEAYDDVSVKLEGGFSATGTRLSYVADTQRYHMQGGPVRILEEKPPECRETTGAVLTFTRSIDSISVDGTDGNRSRTRPVPCAERRR